jgi:hypothetical protein
MLGVAKWRSEADVHIAQVRVLAEYALVTPENPWTTENGVRSLLGREFSSVEIDSKLVHYRFPSATACVQPFFARLGSFIKIAESFGAAEGASFATGLRGPVAPAMRLSNTGQSDDQVGHADNIRDTDHRRGAEDYYIPMEEPDVIYEGC